MDRYISVTRQLEDADEESVTTTSVAVFNRVVGL